MKTVLLFLALVLAGCSAGEYTFQVYNRSEAPVTIEGGREPVTVAPGSTGKAYVSREEGTQVVLKSEGKELDKVQAGGAYTMPSTKEQVFYFAGDPKGLVLTDLGEFFVVDSTLDKAMAEKNPKVKLVAKMESSPVHVVKRQMFLPPDDRVVKSLPQSSHPYRLVKVPEAVTDEQLEQFLQDEFQQAAATQQ